MIIHRNDWGKFITETIITDDAFGMISVDYYKDEPKTAFIHDFGVIPFARKSGIGTALLKKALEQARMAQCEFAELNYNNVSTPIWVFNWYERNGFEEIEFGNKNHLMRKKL